MFPNCFLQNFLWCLPCKMPYGNGHYVTGPDLAILSNLICIEQGLTKFSCNLLGCAPKAPCMSNSHRKEKKIMSQGYNNWGYNNNCCHQEEKKEYFPKCECCCYKYYEKKEETKKEEPKCNCATIKVCIEEEKKEEKKDDCCY